MKTIDLLTIAEVAEILHVSKQKVSAIIKSGELNVINLGPRSRRISRTDFEDYLKKKGSV
jgi:excisionase family DNA binding protein